MEEVKTNELENVTGGWEPLMDDLVDNYDHDICKHFTLPVQERCEPCIHMRALLPAPGNGVYYGEGKCLKGIFHFVDKPE